MGLSVDNMFTMGAFVISLLWPLVLGAAINAGEDPDMVTSAHCPSGWFDAFSEGMGCLLFETNQTFTWLDAQDYCVTRNGFLVGIQNRDQFNLVIDKLWEYSFAPFHIHWWLTSGTDEGHDGRWVWTSPWMIS